MSYGGVSSKTNSGAIKIGDISTKVKGLDLEGVWSGSAYNTMSSAIDDVCTDFETVKSQLTSFAGILNLLDQYIALVVKIDGLRQQLSGLDPEDDKELIESINAQIVQLEAERVELKSNIISRLGAFSVIGGTASTITLSNYSLEEIYQKVGAFSALPVGNVISHLTIYDENGNVVRDGQEYFDSVINDIKRKYTGVERNYYVSMAIVDLSLEAGVRTPYAHNGTAASGKTEDTRIAVPGSTFKNGIDCNAFASFVIFDENSTTKWLAVQQYPYAGEGVTYETAQAGDVFANGGHVGMVVANNPETQELVILHATGPAMKFETKSYASMQANGNVIRRVDSTYVSPSLAECLGIEPVTGSATNVSINENFPELPKDTDSVTVQSTNLDDANVNNLSVLNVDSIPGSTVNLNGNVYSGEPLTAPQGINRNGPEASETWYDLNMNRVVKNMEELYGFSDLEYSIRNDGVKVLSGVNAEGEAFSDLVMVAADVKHPLSNPTGIYERGQIVDTSLGKGIVVDYCERAVNERKADGNVHFDIATAWWTEPYQSVAYGRIDKESISGETIKL